MFRESFHLFLVYRSFAFPILVASSIVVPCWLAFRLYRLRATGHRPSFHREALLLTFVVYLSGLAAVTLVPSGGSRSSAESSMGDHVYPNLASLTCTSATLPAGSSERAFCVRNARGNVMLFFPLGVLIPLVWRRLRFSRGVQTAIAVSCGIELVQYLSRGWINRSSDLNDIVLNVLGACIGLALVALLRLVRSTRPAPVTIS